MSLTVPISFVMVKRVLWDSYRALAHLEYCEKIHVRRDRYFRFRVLSPQTTIHYKHGNFEEVEKNLYAHVQNVLQKMSHGIVSMGY